jgi:hypothetical protein
MGGVPSAHSRKAFDTKATTSIRFDGNRCAQPVQSPSAEVRVRTARIQMSEISLGDFVKWTDRMLSEQLHRTKICLMSKITNQFDPANRRRFRGNSHQHRKMNRYYDRCWKKVGGLPAPDERLTRYKISIETARCKKDSCAK